MAKPKPTIRAVMVASFLLSLDCGRSNTLALGSTPTHDPPWDPARIERLPPDVRRIVFSMCREQPTAGHYFVTYLKDSKIVKLHFEYFSCEGRLRFCRDAGSCLHAEFVASDSRYRLLRTYYGRPDD